MCGNPGHEHEHDALGDDPRPAGSMLHKRGPAFFARRLDAAVEFGHADVVDHIASLCLTRSEQTSDPALEAEWMRLWSFAITAQQMRDML